MYQWRGEEKSKGRAGKKHKSHVSVKSLTWLEVSARKAGIPYLEYASMPIGELSDFVDFFSASEGCVELREVFDDQYIPEVM